MTTALELVSLALKDCGAYGVGQTVPAGDLTDALLRLNMMISQWARRRWLVYHLVETSAAASGAASYTVGAGQTFNLTDRIDRIDAVYARLNSTGDDASLQIIQSREEFDRIRSKALAGAPRFAFFDSGYPTGNLYVWPLASNLYTLKIATKSVLQSFAALTDAVSLPPEYEEAIYFNLIQRLRAGYRLAPDAYFDKMAEESLAVIQGANLQEPQLRAAKVANRSISDLLMLALEDSGAFPPGKPPSFQDLSDALWRLNMTLGQWNRRRWLVYNLVDTAVACTGVQSYTVGAGGDFNIARPDRIEAAYLRQVVPSLPNMVDFPLRLIEAREDYARIALKSLAASPSDALFYDSGYPLGRVYPVPLPNSNYELHLLTKVALTTFASLEDVISLPPEYEQAVYSTVAIDARAVAQLPPDPVLVGRNKAALATLRKSNAQIGLLKMPAGIPGSGRAYNVFADR